MKKTPFQQITEELSCMLSDRQVSLLPKKWEKVGNVLILRLADKLVPYERKIAEVYATVLSCKSVLKDIGGIGGEFRKPKVSLIYGDENTVTIHKENGVIFKLDPSEIMFSSGNMSERKRMGELVSPDERIVDLFAGIGYFSLPIAVHGNPKKVYSCELNPVAYKFLKENISLNNVSDIVIPLLGNNAEVAPYDIVNRVIMGFFGETHRFLPLAFKCLHNQVGIIHFHDKFPDRIVPKVPFSYIQKVAEDFYRSVTLQHVQKVKSFAPGISHYVLDVKVERK